MNSTNNDASFGSKLADDDYARFHLLRKQASSMDDCQQKKFNEIIQRQSSIWKGKAVKVLSIGSGTGDFDFQIISSIFANKLAIKKYVCIEPIKENTEPLKANLRKVLTEDQFEVIESIFEDSDFSTSFDFIHNVHVIHWMKDPVAALKKMDNLLKENGLVVSVLQSNMGMPRIYDRLKSNLQGGLTAEKLMKKTNAEGLNYHMDYVSAQLDVTSIIHREETGKKILQFVISSKLDENQFEQLILLIKELAKEENGKFIIEEPFAFITNR
ncbi:MAG TPA: class I SAM-dependent methyltransferase [Parachlamydiaceae bacterium]|nr:class I SAM-dependent methyltransferase [Parachlamydiaceae bacterium]